MPNLSVARILIISDNRGRSAELEGLLLAAGYDCRRLSTAELSSEEIEEFNPDLLLPDLEPLREKDEGYPIIRRLKKRGKAPIIALLDPDDLGNFDITLGLDDFIDESNPVRVIDAFVEALDLAELGFEGVEPAATGRPA